MITAIAVVFVLTLSVGMPIAICLGMSSFIALIGSELPFRLIAERMFNSVNSFPLMAIPLFMIIGEIMDSAGILNRLIGFAQCFVGHVRGGLAQVTTITEMILSGVSGTAVGDAAALSATLLPAMKKEYGVEFASAVVASAASIGPIIPPSAAMVVYSFMSGGMVSVAGLFLAGVVPGIMIGVGMMFLNYYIAKKRGYPVSQRLSIRDLIVRTKEAFFILMMPIVVLGGIVGGIFTATEGAAVGVVYSIVIGFFVTRELKFQHIWRALVNGMVTSGVVLLLVALASSVTFLLTIEQLPNTLGTFLRSLTTSPVMFILLVNVLLIFVGMLLESTAAYIMLVPILAPIASVYGIDPLHFGFLFVFNLVIGMLTPPVGVVLFVVGGYAGLSIERLTRAVFPYIVVQYAVLGLCIVFPKGYLFLPRLFGY